MAKLRREKFDTTSGIELPNDFNPSNSEPIEYEEHLGDPGTFPYTRGVRPSMYRGKLWTMRQYAGFASAEESNARYKYLLSQGTTGLSVAFDLPTQIGLDSDDPLAMGEGVLHDRAAVHRFLNRGHKFLYSVLGNFIRFHSGLKSSNGRAAGGIMVT